jgi:UDP-2,3-diacylglucosamine pyrophosphatase LpxH
MDRTRVFIASDLHLGGEPPYMMSQPKRLAEFINALPSFRREGEKIELVIAGDFIDFLAIPPIPVMTADLALEARQKVLDTATGYFKPVFDALATYASGGNWLTILVGNHDVEMVLPNTQEALLKVLRVGPHQVLFIGDGRAYRVGNALIEHGNRYDGPNQNDWSALRALASTFSRSLPPTVDLQFSAGSEIVYHVVNLLKPRYPFIDLLQPQGEMLAYLLVAFEPKLRYDWRKIKKLFSAARLLRHTNPVATTNVAASGTNVDPELEEVFGDLYRSFRKPDLEIGTIGDWLNLFATPSEDSLSRLIEERQPIPRERLQQIQVALRRMLLDDRSALDDGPTEQYGTRAVEMLTNGVQTIVMGHTHLARHIGPQNQATYINTGTWADVVRLPSSALNPGFEGLLILEQFLQRLMADEVREFHPTYGIAPV